MNKIIVIGAVGKSLYNRLCSKIAEGLEISEGDIEQREFEAIEDLIGKEEEIAFLGVGGSSSYLPTSKPVQNVVSLTRYVIEHDIPYFGSCFGMQLLAHALDPEKGKLQKRGFWDVDVPIEITQDDPVFKEVSNPFETRQYHNYSAQGEKEQTTLGNAQILAGCKLTSKHNGIEVIKVGNVLATQFHPESVYASEDAQRVLYNHLQGLK